MTVTNFDSDTVANSRSTSATFSGWTFGSGSTTDIADTDTSLATVLLNMSVETQLFLISTAATQFKIFISNLSMVRISS